MEKEIGRECPYKTRCLVYRGEYNGSPILKDTNEIKKSVCDNYPFYESPIQQNSKSKTFVPKIHVCPIFDIITCYEFRDLVKNVLYQYFLVDREKGYN